MKLHPASTARRDAASERRAPSTLSAAARACAAALGLLLCGSAQEPVATGIDRLVAADSVQHLAAETPIARGEAALVLAATAEPHHEATLLALASDPEPEARQRATIALGILATPAAVERLERRLLANEGLDGDDAVAAAFGLGIVPPDRVGTSAARLLPVFRRGSWKRQQDTLVALLLGMRASAAASGVARGEFHALRELYDDDSNRSPDVRGLLLELLLPIDGTIEDRALRRILQRGSDQERHAVLGWLASRPAADNAAWLEDLAHAATHDRSPHNRSTALLALTRSRYLPALEIAARALRSSSPDECAQGLSAMLAIGGPSARGPLEAHLVDERDPARKAALLASYAAPPSARLLEHAAHVASDGDQAFAVRAAAAGLLARSQPERAAPVLRDLFRRTDDPATLATLAADLQRTEATPAALDRLLEQPVDLTQHPDRWQALLAAGHAEAQRQVLAVLEQRPARPEALASALRAWRRACVLDCPAHDAIEAPARLAALLR